MVIAEEITLAFMDPRGSVRKMTNNLAPRPPDLSGKVLGVVDDGLPNCDDLLGGVTEELGKRYRLADVIRVVKPSFSSPLPKAAHDELARRIDVAIVGVGI